MVEFLGFFQISAISVSWWFLMELVHARKNGHGTSEGKRVFFHERFTMWVWFSLWSIMRWNVSTTFLHEFLWRIDRMYSNWTSVYHESFHRSLSWDSTYYIDKMKMHELTFWIDRWCIPERQTSSRNGISRRPQITRDDGMKLMQTREGSHSIVDFVLNTREKDYYPTSNLPCLLPRLSRILSIESRWSIAFTELSITYEWMVIDGRRDGMGWEERNLHESECLEDELCVLLVSFARFHTWK